MSLALLVAAAAATPSGAFSCALDEVAALTYSAGEARASMIEGLPAEILKFRIEFAGDEATIDWPDSPIQVSGKQSILHTAPGAGMILTVSPGPCLFTEADCAAMLHYAQQPDGSLLILVTPTAVTYNPDNSTRFPFMVWMSGRCLPGKDGK